MAAIIGKDGIHKVIGQICDLCGLECEGEKEELNALDCTYPACNEEASVYHQDCIEKYLRSIRLEKNRKTGYHCPRGSSKNSRFSDTPCPGRVTKSHPIHIRNDQAKKRLKAKPAEPAPPPHRPVKGKGKATETHDQSKDKRAEPKGDLKGKPFQGKAKPKAVEGQIRHLAGPSFVKDSMQEPAAKPKPLAKLPDAPKDVPSDKERAYKARLELGMKQSPPRMPKPAIAAATVTDNQTLKDRESTKAARPVRTVAAQPVVSAWQRSSSIASLVRSYSSAQTASDAASLESGTPRSILPDEGTPTRQQPLPDGRSMVKSDTAGTKEGQVQTASPITPNAIKAFQPDQLPESQSDFDLPLGSATGPQDYLLEDCQRSSFDGESICSDEVSDALFAMDPSSDSDGDKLGTALHHPSFSSELETDHSGTEQESDYRSGDKSVSPDGAKSIAVDSNPGSDASSFARRPAAARLDQQFQQAVAWQKAVALAVQYQELGYSCLQGVAAVNKWGDNMQAALQWLLSSSCHIHQESLSNETATVDISDELSYMSQCQKAFALPQNVLQQIVIDAKGSLTQSLSVMQSFPQTSHAPNMIPSTQFLAGARVLSLSGRQTKPNGIGPLPEHQTGIARDAAVPELQHWHQQNASCEAWN